MVKNINMEESQNSCKAVSHPPFDDELKPILHEILKKIKVPFTLDLIDKAREAMNLGSLTDDQIRRGGAFEFEEKKIPGPEGAPSISVIVCRPRATPGPHPVIYNIHGGGMVSGNYRTAELARELNRAEALQMAVVSVNYRLAPENPDPAPVEDCYAALVWLVKHSKSLKLDANRIIVSGNSAGGGLAAGVALLARDRGGPFLIGQMLQCPMLDDRCDSFSIKQMKGVGLWESTSNLTGWSALLGDKRGTESVSCYAAPARAKNFSGLPPAFIDVGAVEALRDEAVFYANHIWQAGGDAELHVWSGAFHSFDQWAPDAIVSKSADQVRIDWMRRLLKRN
ncbi:MAG: alpha/beta hydrolase [Candidatus Paracaedibacteraceae bacterium]|nr:alpha/beta hydrolase [Candidatus Paracaedibacteraceae bacterium]